MNSKTLPQPSNDSESRILGHVREHGWAVIGIPADSAGPSYSFSVGMVHSLGHPELVIAGMAIEKAKSFINELGERIRKGDRFEPSDRREMIFAGLSACVLKVLPRYYKEYLGSAIWINGGKNFEALQVVWPDKSGVFPWQNGYDPKLIGTQIILGEVENFPFGWPFPDPPTLGTYVARSIVDKSEPLRVAYHDANSDWQFMADTQAVPSNGQYMAFSEVVHLFPELTELSTMPPNHRAIRKGDQWEIEPYTPPEA